MTATCDVNSGSDVEVVPDGCSPSDSTSDEMFPTLLGKVGATKHKGCGGCGNAGRKESALQPVTTSAFELFKVGIGPSSSHTVGPLVACRNFMRDLVFEGFLDKVAQIKVELCGSLALTGIGHYTNKAVILGLHGISPAEVDTASVEPFLEKVANVGKLEIGFGGGEPTDVKGFREIDFDEMRDIIFSAEELPLHPNGMICLALDTEGQELKQVTYYSIGGGFIMTEAQMLDATPHATQVDVPFPFSSMSELVRVCRRENLSISAVMRRNEEARRSPQEVDAGLRKIWQVMEECVNRGLAKEKAGMALPGPLGITRRAPDLYEHALSEDQEQVLTGLMDEMRWLDCYALAVMEENACMGRVVTAPTNGASGIVPATLTYYMRHLRHKQREQRRQDPSTFLLAAAAVGILAKERACISGAAGGCQAEVGTATAMAAAGLCAVLGGRPEQVEEAAEIALEHSLGMTCDPVLGLVQVPCIERNAMGAAKALNAVSLVMKSPVTRRRSMLGYDDVLRVMKSTGDDMPAKYRETAQGGLAADYEAALERQPDRWKEVQEMMGASRIQFGPRRKATVLVKYEEVSHLDVPRPPRDLGKC
eukprot:CAMPEP_0115207396 /NCGR_PEP_ID=MMETSP0270-20121206/20695_1 /TAXON_ID=71861 /ORGANISM="Scrippsiella trochoidea, Strain CCMP3099" /LENGTH=592 /DNA_ID=CAMNT_0002620989 /DNA_START=83 /DNA_END=1861 /DNA_ORIENTATION=+